MDGDALEHVATCFRPPEQPFLVAPLCRLIIVASGQTWRKHQNGRREKAWQNTFCTVTDVFEMSEFPHIPPGNSEKEKINYWELKVTTSRRKVHWPVWPSNFCTQCIQFFELFSIYFLEFRFVCISRLSNCNIPIAISCGLSSLLKMLVSEQCSGIIHHTETETRFTWFNGYNIHIVVAAPGISLRTNDVDYYNKQTLTSKRKNREQRGDETEENKTKVLLEVIQYRSRRRRRKAGQGIMNRSHGYRRVLQISCIRRRTEGETEFHTQLVVTSSCTDADDLSDCFCFLFDTE